MRIAKAFAPLNIQASHHPAGVPGLLPLHRIQYLRMMRFLREKTFRMRIPASREDLRTPRRTALETNRLAMCISQLITLIRLEKVALNSGLFVEVLLSSPLSSTISAIIGSSLLVSIPGMPNP